MWGFSSYQNGGRRISYILLDATVAGIVLYLSKYYEKGMIIVEVKKCILCGREAKCVTNLPRHYKCSSCGEYIVYGGVWANITKYPQDITLMKTYLGKKKKEGIIIGIKPDNMGPSEVIDNSVNVKNISISKVRAYSLAHESKEK